MIPLLAEVTLAELVARFGGDLDEGTSGIVVRALAPSGEAGPGSLSPLFSRRLVRSIAAPCALLVSAELASVVPRGARWIHPRAELALARLLATLDGLELAPAVIDPSAQVGPGAVILAGATIGARVRVEPNAVIYGRVVLEADVIVGAGAVIGRQGFGFATDEGGNAVRVPHLGGVRVELGAEIGALATVDAGVLAPTVIGRGAKLDAHVHVGHNAVLGAGSRVAAQAGFAGSVRLGRGVLVGGQAGVADHVTIGDGARLAAKAGVIGDVAPGATVAGYPAVERSRWLRANARLLRERKP